MEAYRMAKKIYFTFDDGPSDATPLLLDILRKHHVKACFFVTNQYQRPDLLEKIAKDGHTIGLHCWSHCYEEIYASPEAYFNDLKKADDMVYRAVGLHARNIRFPGGSRNKVHEAICQGIMEKITVELLKQDYRIIDWDCENNDGSLPNLPAKAYFAYFLNHIQSMEECVFLSHNRPSDTGSILSLDMILDYCEKNGWETDSIDNYSGPMLVHNDPVRKFVRYVSRPESPFLLLINKDQMMSRFRAEGLKLVSYEDIAGIPVRIEKNTLIAFLKMKNYLAGKGIRIGIGSAYRSVNDQKTLWYQGMELYGHNEEECMARVALPWASEHHTGLAVDILLYDSRSGQYQRASPEDKRYRVIHRSLCRFGFILRYPEGKQAVTGFAFTPWHLRYVGASYAGEMYRQKLTLEEYTMPRGGNDSSSEAKKNTREEEKKRRKKRYIQILLMGCDVDNHKMKDHTATEKDRCRNSDTMVVLSLDRRVGRVKLISLMRDTWVNIPGHGMKKLNAAVVFGGPKLAVQVVNDAFDLNIRKYALITVYDLVRLVDAAGGLDLDLTREEGNYINEWMPNVRLITGLEDDVPEIVHDGINHLNGMQTLAHVRNRSVGYMAGRENRAHQVLAAIASKVRNEMTLPQIFRFFLLCKKHIRTNIHISDLLPLIPFAFKVNPSDIGTYHAPAEGTYTVKREPSWHMETDFERARILLWDFLDGHA